MKILQKSMIERSLLILALAGLLVGPALAQEESDEDQATEEPKDVRPARPAWESAWLIDNQSSRVYSVKTLEMVMQHRFGTVKNGITDVFGIYGPANIRIGFNYVPIERLMVGFGYTKNGQLLDLMGKYEILQQTRSLSMPVALTYYINMGIELRSDDNYVNSSDRLFYFHQLIVARRITSNFSAQVAPSLTHFNAVEGYLDIEGQPQGLMENNHIAIATSARYKFTPQTAVILGWDQPITKHQTDNPAPNLSFGVEIATSSHAFQVFFANYQGIVPQYNNMFNFNDYQEGEFLIGFNITRLWAF